MKFDSNGESSDLIIEIMVVFLREVIDSEHVLCLMQWVTQPKYDHRVHYSN